MFVGNSGIRWTSLSGPMKSAALAALEGAIEFWRLIRLLEEFDGEPTRDEFRRLKDSVRDNMARASTEYRTIANQIDPNIRIDVQDQDIIDASITGTRPQLPLAFSEQYRRLSVATEDIVTEVARLDLGMSPREMGRIAFRAMAVWESAANIGRVLAVLNQRAS